MKIRVKDFGKVHKVCVSLDESIITDLKPECPVVKVIPEEAQNQNFSTNLGLASCNGQIKTLEGSQADSISMLFFPLI